MKKRFLLVIVLAVLVVIVLLIGSSPYAWIASKELAVGPHGPSAVQQDVIRAYYEALDTCDVKAYERLTLVPWYEFGVVCPPSKNIQWAKLLSISGPYPANEGDAYLHYGATSHLKSKPVGLVTFRVEEVTKYKSRWWPYRDTKSILMVKETEDSNWLIAAIGH
ncbi:MAG: DUF4829 domain-containing protein [Candidatus Cryosericum sp.]